MRVMLFVVVIMGILGVGKSIIMKLVFKKI